MALAFGVTDFEKPAVHECACLIWKNLSQDLQLFKSRSNVFLPLSGQTTLVWCAHSTHLMYSHLFAFGWKLLWHHTLLWCARGSSFELHTTFVHSKQSTELDLVSCTVNNVLNQQVWYVWSISPPYHWL